MEPITQENNETTTNFSYDKQQEMYYKGLEASVEQFKQMYPDKYKKAQLIGDDMMNKKYELNLGEDLKGDLIKCKNILISILHYGLEKCDLYENDIELLKKVLKDTLNVVYDINDIFNNVEEIEKIINVILTNRLNEIESYY